MEDKKEELTKLEEQKNKSLMASMWVLVISTALFYIGILVLATSILEEGIMLGTIISLSTAVFVIVMLYAFKIEVKTGYYECRKCKHRFVPTYFEGLFAMHIHTTRYLKCPECNKKSWARKVMTKE